MEFDFCVITDNWRFLASGVVVTLALSVLSGVHEPRRRIRRSRCCACTARAGCGRPIVFYIDSMRAIPVLVVLVWTFFALPIVAGITMPPFSAALIGLTVHLAAYAAEIVRAGIESVRPGQTRAALALGMSQRADPAPHRAAAGDRAHAAGLRLARCRSRSRTRRSPR